MRTFRTDDEQLTRDINKAHVNEGKGVYDQDHVVLEAQQIARSTEIRGCRSTTSTSMPARCGPAG